MAGSCCSIF